MRNASDALKDIITGGSYSMRLIVDVFDVEGKRTLTGLAADRWGIRWDRDGSLKSVGNLRVAHASEDGKPLAPVKVSDPLAPYGQEVNLVLEVTAGSFSETVQLGFFRIADVPTAKDAWADFGDGQIAYGSLVELSLEDRLSFVQRRGFRVEENPASTSAWDELARISGMQVVRSVSDATVPEDLVYQATRGGRLQGVKQLATALGGTEYTTAEGSLTVLSGTPGDPVGELRLGETGTIVGDDGGMDSTDVFNVVVGDFETAERTPIHVERAASGVLAPSLVREHTHYFTDETVTDETAAIAAVEAELARVSRPAKRITVQCITDPLIELGDVRTVDRPRSTITGQVAKVNLSGSATMTVDLDVIDDGD